MRIRTVDYDYVYANELNEIEKRWKLTIKNAKMKNQNSAEKFLRFYWDSVTDIEQKKAVNQNKENEELKFIELT